MVYQITHPDYMGSIEGLYRELNTNRSSLQTFALAVLVEGFLSYLKEQETELDLDETSNFLVITATLLDIKARLLFPVPKPDDPEPEDSLLVSNDPETHLVEYRHYQQIAAWLAEMGHDRQQLISREPIEPADLGIPGPDPLVQITMRDLVRAFNRVFLADDHQEALAPVYRDPWTVEDRLRWLEQLLAAKGVMAFNAVFQPGSGRMLLIVTFLALLELIKIGAVGAQQSCQDDEIMLVWLGRSR